MIKKKEKKDKFEDKKCILCFYTGKHKKHRIHFCQNFGMEDTMYHTRAINITPVNTASSILPVRNVWMRFVLTPSPKAKLIYICFAIFFIFPPPCTTRRHTLREFFLPFGYSIKLFLLYHIYIIFSNLFIIFY